MRTYTTKEKMRIVVEPIVYCDECGKECSNCNLELKFIFSFSENPEHFKDICLTCWDAKGYKKEWSERKTKDFEEMLKIHKEEKEKEAKQ